MPIVIQKPLTNSLSFVFHLRSFPIRFSFPGPVRSAALTRVATCFNTGCGEEHVHRPDYGVFGTCLARYPAYDNAPRQALFPTPSSPPARMCRKTSGLKSAPQMDQRHGLQGLHWRAVQGVPNAIGQTDRNSWQRRKIAASILPCFPTVPKSDPAARRPKHLRNRSPHVPWYKTALARPCCGS